jgi:hypothetical protein
MEKTMPGDRAAFIRRLTNAGFTIEAASSTMAQAERIGSYERTGKPDLKYKEVYSIRLATAVVSEEILHHLVPLQADVTKTITIRVRDPDYDAIDLLVSLTDLLDMWKLKYPGLFTGRKPRPRQKKGNDMKPKSTECLRCQKYDYSRVPRNTWRETLRLLVMEQECPRTINRFVNDCCDRLMAPIVKYFRSDTVFAVKYSYRLAILREAGLESLDHVLQDATCGKPKYRLGGDAEQTLLEQVTRDVRTTPIGERPGPASVRIINDITETLIPICAVLTGHTDMEAVHTCAQALAHTVYDQAYLNAPATQEVTRDSRPESTPASDRKEVR